MVLDLEDKPEEAKSKPKCPAVQLEPEVKYLFQNYETHISNIFAMFCQKLMAAYVYDLFIQQHILQDTEDSNKDKKLGLIKIRILLPRQNSSPATAKESQS